MSSTTVNRAIAILGALLLVSVAHADEELIAQSLFETGRKLMAQKNFAEACPKFEESFRLDPAPGTLLNLAVCNEGLGKTATAWRQYKDVVAFSKKDGRADREAYARAKADAVEPKLSHLTIRLTDADGAVEVRLDGTGVGTAALNVAVPIDPGTHTIRAVAPGKVAVEIGVTIGGPADQKQVLVPHLEDEKTPAPVASSSASAVASTPVKAPPPPTTVVLAPRPKPVDEPRAAPDRTLTWVFGSVAIAGLAVGTFAGIETIAAWNVRKRECTGDECSPDGLDAHGRARIWANVSNVGFGVALLSAGGAVWSYLAAPEAKPHAVRVSPTIGASAAGMIVDVTF